MESKSETKSNTSFPMEVTSPSLDDDDLKIVDFEVYVGPENSQTKFVVPKKDLSISRLFVASTEEDKSGTKVYFPQVGAKEFEAILPYMKHHSGVPAEIIPFPCKSKIMKEVCKDQWDAEYIDQLWEKDRDLLFKVLLASNYLDIKCLLHLGCCKIASLVKGTEYDKLAETILPKNLVASVSKKN